MSDYFVFVLGFNVKIGWMLVLKSIILGLVQGLTEFIPVSSSGHLLLMDRVLHFSAGGFAFETLLDLGTLLALIAFFWKDFVKLAKSIFVKDENTKLAWFLVLATIPGVLGGVLLEHAAKTVFRSSSLVAVNLIVIGVVLWLADHLGRKQDGLKAMTPIKALGVGFAQVLALIPGVSRAGITISAGLAEGFDRVSATRFSFLLSAPIIAGATIKVLLEHDSLHMISSFPMLFVAGNIAALVSGYWAIKFMLSYLEKHGLKVFAYYRILVGLLVLIVLR